MLVTHVWSNERKKSCRGKKGKKDKNLLSAWYLYFQPTPLSHHSAKFSGQEIYFFQVF